MRATADKDWVLLWGQTLTQAFANQDFGDGVHFAYQFLEGGDMRGMNMGQPVRGHWRVVPGNYHSQIRQDAVVLVKGKGSAAAAALIAYLKSDPARAVIKSYGYDF